MKNSKALPLIISSNESSIYKILVIAIIASIVITANQINNSQKIIGIKASKQSAMGKQRKPIYGSPYKNGSYNMTGEYMSPGGPEQIDVKLTLQDGLVTEALVIAKAENRNSIKYQNIFIENYKDKVVGEYIDSLELDKISGSSLTPKGFNDALNKVRAQALNS